MLDDVCQEAKSQMDKAVATLKKHLASIRTGRASVSILDGIRVDYYGNPSPIGQIASVTVPDSRSLMIKPWDKMMLKVIEKAIQESNLGLTPMVDSDIVRVPVPSLTEERRKEFVKQARQRGEDAKVAVRNARRDANEMLKDALKDKSISEDDEKRGLKTTQDLTDTVIAEIDGLMQHKESEIMVV
ncbi:MAG: ribosome recycling factor [Deltaproteobacteria bacterium]|nr:ribosome recycling factor [Deltaproteobacteria bacterium]